MEHYSCPYSDEELDYWDGVSNPMGDACNDCLNYECEHNMNADPDMPMPPWQVEYEEEVSDDKR